MKPELILQADILDIIFEGKNKQYGAYDLRKGYNHRINIALTGISSVVAIMVILSVFERPQRKSFSNPPVADVDTVIISSLPENRPKPPIEPPPPTQATIKNPTFVLTNDPDTDTLATNNQLDQNLQIGLENRSGDSTFSDAPPPSNEVTGTGASPSPEPEPVPKEEILRTAQIMPEFPGGLAAFTRFLSKHLRVPENSMEPGQKLKIIVRFVVGKEGEISDFFFLQTSGEVFEKEVLRVMKKMPKWTPGSQNGEKVRVYFNLPVIFEAPEE